jgi:hypothetical protein
MGRDLKPKSVSARRISSKCDYTLVCPAILQVQRPMSFSCPFDDSLSFCGLKVYANLASGDCLGTGRFHCSSRPDKHMVLMRRDVDVLSS